ncbi:MAG TPA: iron chelate uptake ABC transporter family permease subunit [Cellulomonas sp.]
MTARTITAAEAAPRPAARRRPLGVRVTGLLIGLIALAVLVVASVALGSKTIPLDQVASAVLHPGHSDTDLVITALRIPRTALALLVGAALAVGGALIQAFTRNPLADPGILGVNAGSALTVVVGIAFFGLTSVSQYLWLALGGAAVATVLVWLIGTLGRRGATPVRMTLAGVGLTAVFGGVTSMISLASPRTLQAMIGWMAGSIVGAPLSTAGAIAPLVILGLVIAGVIARDLNAMALGDELSAALGSRTAATRILAIVAVTLLAGSATAAAGPIGFVGLACAHIVRSIVGPDHRLMLPGVLVTGPALLLSADLVGRVAVAPSELQTGIAVAVLGGPLFIALVRSRRLAAL